MSWGDELAYEPAPAAPTLPLDDLLRAVADSGSSDLHLTAGAPPTMRLRGEMQAIDGFEVLQPDILREAIYAILTERQRKVLEETRELDFAYTVPGFARFREIGRAHV